jgi:hypothetical protein
VLGEFGTLKECAEFNATLEVPRQELKEISSAILNRLPVIDFNIEDIPSRRVLPCLPAQGGQCSR